MMIFRISRRAFAAACALLAAVCATADAGALLINAQQATFRMRPEYVREHFAHIDTLPFDGMVFSTDTSRGMMYGGPRSYEQMVTDFAPLNGLNFTRMRHNFALVNLDRSADFFGDWSVTVQNFRTLARVLKEKGFAGICFDNEEYWSNQFNYPDDCADPSKSIAEYSAQARLRGREIMQAITAEYPEIVFLVFFGPYSSHPGTPNDVTGGGSAVTQELRGPFTVGLLEGAHSRTRFVDGGEVYSYRSVADFQTSYDFRKFTLASAAENCLFIPAALRPVWPQKVSISFGLYNLRAPMDAAIMRTTLERALRRCDDYVWLYFEGENWNVPGEVAQGWVDAVVGARAAVQVPVVNAAPSVSITGPAVGARFNAPATITIAANASDADGSVSKVEFFHGTTKLGESLAAPYSYVWTNPAAGTFSLTAKATDNSGATTTSGAVSVTVGATFSASINFQVAGTAAPAGYFADTGATYASRGNGLTYGWNTSHTACVQDSEKGGDRRLATLCRFRSDGIWEIAVPNGTYSVTVAIGDGSAQSTHTINAEGVNFWNAQPLAAGQFVNRTLPVTVTDGKLSISKGSAADLTTRIDYVLIAATGTPPAAPGGLTAAAVSASTVELKWADHSSTETGFQVRRSTTADFAASTLIATLGADQTAYTDTGRTAGTTYYYRVRATSVAGDSAFSNTPSATPRRPDLDGDGIPDALESAPCAAGTDDRQIDSDGDGFSNASEYFAGTNPLDGNSRLRVTPLTAPGGAGATAVTLNFSTVAGLHYAVDFTDSLDGGIWTLVPGSDRTGDGAQQSVAETAASPARFYRLLVWR